MTWSSFSSRSLVSVQRLKMESTEHAASLTGFPRNRPAPPAAAAIYPTARSRRAVPWSGLINGGKRDKATSPSSFWSECAELIPFCIKECFSPSWSNSWYHTAPMRCVRQSLIVSMPVTEPAWPRVWRIVSALVKLISGVLANGVNTRTLRSTSGVTAWYLKTNAAPFLKTGLANASVKW